MLRIASNEVVGTAKDTPPLQQSLSALPSFWGRSVHHTRGDHGVKRPHDHQAGALYLALVAFNGDYHFVLLRPIKSSQVYVLR